jgi:MFS transporter, DHA1 family, multidrug resistance protein
MTSITDVVPRAVSRYGRLRDRMNSAAVLVIAFGAGMASFSMNFWIPFLPLYMKELGATSDANALVWVGIATTGQGVARLVSGPIWGVLSDRVGRKLMYIRALYFATATTFIAAFATEPWHVAIAFACQGLFSGFIPAAVALTSVTVPDSKLNSSLGLVTAAQYLGNTVGPAVGAGLAIVFGLRGAIVAAAIMPALAATLVVFMVPRDRVSKTPQPAANADGEPQPQAPSFWKSLSFQFYLALFLYFFLFAMTQMVRLATPLALGDITGGASVEGTVGIAFTVAGVASVVGVLIIGRRWIRPGVFVKMLVLGSILTAVAHVLLAFSMNVPLFILWFSLISLFQAAMLPASNTLIASAVPRDRRGTAFGLAGSAQALAFMVGPMTAAGFAAVSMNLGFIVFGLLFVGLAVLLYFKLREPTLNDGPVTQNAKAT